MQKYYVYHIKSQNRLVILRTPVVDDDYEHLMDSTGNSTSYEFCKMFCIGLIMGAQFGASSNKTYTNDLREFQ